MDELISRNEAIDLLKQMRKDGDMVPWEGKDVFARIRELPAEPHWIPVTERLPEEEDSIFARYYGTDRWRKSMFRRMKRLCRLLAMRSIRRL